MRQQGYHNSLPSFDKKTKGEGRRDMYIDEEIDEEIHRYKIQRVIVLKKQSRTYILPINTSLEFIR